MKKKPRLSTLVPKPKPVVIPKQMKKSRASIYAFCLALSEGKNRAIAYRETHDISGLDEKTIHKKANSCYYSKKVRTLTREIIMNRYSGVALKMKQRIEILSDMAVTGNPADSLKAIDILNKMDGSYIEKKEVEVNMNMKYNSLADWYEDES